MQKHSCLIDKEGNLQEAELAKLLCKMQGQKLPSGGKYTQGTIFKSDRYGTPDGNHLQTDLVAAFGAESDLIDGDKLLAGLAVRYFGHKEFDEKLCLQLRKQIVDVFFVQNAISSPAAERFKRLTKSALFPEGERIHEWYSRVRKDKAPIDVFVLEGFCIKYRVAMHVFTASSKGEPLAIPMLQHHKMTKTGKEKLQANNHPRVINIVHDNESSFILAEIVEVSTYFITSCIKSIVGTEK